MKNVPRTILYLLILFCILFILSLPKIISTRSPQNTVNVETNKTAHLLIISPSPTPSPSPSSSPTPHPTPSPVPAMKQIKVLSIAYYPVKDNYLDKGVVNNSWQEYDMSLDQVRAKVKRLNDTVSSSLTIGTAYKKFKNSLATPYINYTVVNHIELLEPILTSNKTNPYDKKNKLTDYNKLFNDHIGCNLIDKQDIREIWLWSYTGLNRTGWESNFSSHVGDVGNSDKDTSDLPVCNHSYTVYEYNYGRETPEAIHDHIHQFEGIFRFLNQDLFWNRFVGYYPGNNLSQTGTPSLNHRCGWAHFPPNATKDYDWANMNSVTSDCSNWDPQGGPQESLTCQTWNCDQLGFFIYWMQNIPNAQNNLTYQGSNLRNWWDFVVDFDAAISVKQDLVY